MAVTALLNRYSPWLQYDSQESFFSDSASILTDGVSPGPPARPNLLRRADGTVLASADGAPAALNIEFLAADSYLSGAPVRDTDYLDAVGRDYVADARRMHGLADYGDRIYGRKTTDAAGSRWLQYWFFAYYNNKSFLGIGLHEGDWEMIQIRLGANDEPDEVTFAQHAHGERRSWPELETRDGAPIVYVALGSHASHPHRGKYEAPVVPDYNDAAGPLVRPSLDLLDDDFPAWVLWPGRWGSSRKRLEIEADSPRGPSKHAQWRDPAAFHADARPGHEVRRAAQASRQLPEPPAPILHARRAGDRAIVDYAFAAREPGQPTPTSIVLTIDSPDDTLPPATHTYPVVGDKGSETLPLLLEPARYEIRASASSEDGRIGPTAAVALDPP
jgi:hypothetical protein